MRDESRDRLLVPLMVPLLAVVIIVVLVLAFSRILLAVEPEYATPIALAMALNVLTAGALIASVPRLRGKLLVTMVVLASLLMVGGGVTAMAVSGELGELREALFAEEKPKEKPAESPPAESPPAGESPAEESPAPTGEVTTAVTAKDISFNLDELVFTAGEAATLTFENQDSVPHNVSIYTEQGGENLFEGEIFPGPDSRDYDIPALDAGSYYFQCDVHPNMNGSVAVG
jgi:plastocyanin